MEQVYYAGIASPIGTIWAAATEAGLLQVNFPREKEAFIGSIRRRVDAQIVHDPDMFEDLRGLLEAYFEGEQVVFDLPFDLRGTGFQKDVWRAIYEIPYGRLSSYGRLASKVGRPKSARAVGNACGANPIAIVIPCHRVIRSDGGIGGFGGKPELKRHLLSIEGMLPRAKGMEGEYPRTWRNLRQFFV